MRLNEERYYLKFKDYLSECDSNIVSGSNIVSDELKSETLTSKEKRKNDRDESTERRKRSWNITQDADEDKIPPGYKELKSLSKGITEKRTKKPACTRPGEKGHAVYHDELGKFSTKEDATSWSNDADYYGGNRTDCIGGKFKSDGKGRKLYTRHKCGRDKQGKKNTYACKNSKKIKEDMIEGLLMPSEMPTEVLIEELTKRINEGVDLDYMFKLCAALNSSSKGVYPPKKK